MSIYLWFAGLLLSFVGVAVSGGSYVASKGKDLVTVASSKLPEASMSDLKEPMTSFIEVLSSLGKEVSKEIGTRAKSLLDNNK